MDIIETQKFYTLLFFKTIEKLPGRRKDFIQGYLKEMKARLSVDCRNAQNMCYEYKGAVLLFQLIDNFDQDICRRIIGILGVLNDDNLKLLARRDTFLGFLQFLNKDCAREMIIEILYLILKMAKLEVYTQVFCHNTKCLEKIVLLYIHYIKLMNSPVENTGEQSSNIHSLLYVICATLKACVADNRINQAEVSIITPMTVDYLVNWNTGSAELHSISCYLLLLIAVLEDNTLCQVNFIMHCGVEAVVGILKQSETTPNNYSHIRVMASNILFIVYCNPENEIPVHDETVGLLLKLISEYDNPKSKLTLIVALHNIIKKNDGAFQEFCDLNGLHIITSMLAEFEGNEEYLQIAAALIEKFKIVESLSNRTITEYQAPRCKTDNSNMNLCSMVCYEEPEIGTTNKELSQVNKQTLDANTGNESFMCFENNILEHSKQQSTILYANNAKKFNNIDSHKDLTISTSPPAMEFSSISNSIQLDNYSHIMRFLQSTNIDPGVEDMPLSNSTNNQSSLEHFLSACSGDSVAQERRTDAVPSQSMFKLSSKDIRSKDGFRLEDPLSVEELQYLRDGFKIYGTNFKEIRAKYPFKENRTVKDLYHKYRKDLIKEITEEQISLK